ncbi:hypothetical protein HYFRA_00002171 [Hymenoscyphus fraxineus]|uniref:Uncharacterized protein n=1 Tax=Hymenoscyphus fraxineus TaxID=746836 RepID=A0A9N9PP40_9HELO|nr:hypothetical protein HYFRA_00002171 [Hymenoscyphus fraxineus]
MFSFRLLTRVALVLAWVVCSLGEQWVVAQGGIGISFTFLPVNTIAAVGETVTIKVPNGGNYSWSIVQASFDEPCHYLTGGFHSGIVAADPDKPNTTFFDFSFIVRNQQPIYYNFGEKFTCTLGMAAGVNTPPAQPAFKFRQAAIAATASLNNAVAATAETAETAATGSGIKGLTPSQVKIAMPLIIVSVLLMVAGVVYYLKTRNRAQKSDTTPMDRPELEEGRRTQELDAARPPAELGLKSPRGYVYELSAEEARALRSKESDQQNRGSLYFWRAEIRPSRG